MSKSPLKSSTSAVAFAASAPDAPKVVMEDIPKLGASYGAADAAEWHKATLKCVDETSDQEKRSDRAAYQSLSMALINVEIHDTPFFDTILKSRKVGIPKNKDKLTLGLAVIYELDVDHADKKIRTSHSKKLNSLVASAHQLRSLARDKATGKLAVTFDTAGVEQLMGIIADKKGIAKLEEAYRNEKKGLIATDVIALDPTELAKIRLGRFLAQQVEGAELVIGLGKREANDTVHLDKELTLTAEARNAIAKAFILPNPDVELLRELFVVGGCVREYATKHLVDRFDDPEDKNAPRRLTHAHYVLHPDDIVTISPILMDAGVVVVVRPKLRLFPEPILGHVEFRTQHIHSFRANITEDRVDAFVLSIEPTPELTNGVARLVLSSEAAITDADGNYTKPKLLLQRVISDGGNYPLVLRDFAPVFTMDNVNGTAAIREIATAIKDSGKKATTVTVRATPEGITFSVMKAEQAVRGAAAPKKITLDVMSDDIAALATVLGKLKAGPLSLGLHEDMLVVTFETPFATYGVHIPKRREGGQRSDRFIAKLNPQAWPGLKSEVEADEDGNPSD